MSCLLTYLLKRYHFINTYTSVCMHELWTIHDIRKIKVFVGCFFSSINLKDINKSEHFGSLITSYICNYKSIFSSTVLKALIDKIAMVGN